VDNVALVFPAYNAAATLATTVGEIPPEFGQFRILVDDASDDDTVLVAESLNMQVIRHPVNRGYGGNQKTCYQSALATGADYVVMIHPDNQYDARVAPIMVELIRHGICDVVLGNRIRTRREALDGGMPLWKYIINRASTFAENLFLGQSIGDFHSGFRAYSRRVLETVAFDHNSDDFAFDQEFLIQAVHAGFKIGDVPVPVRYMKEASSISFRRSLRYGIGAVGAFSAMKMHTWGWRRDPRFTLQRVESNDR
jgi:glycosyltransferase involved in cell wall biosynthesis